MELHAVTLLATCILTAFAILFTIIATATNYWPGKLFNCGTICAENATAVGVLLIIAIVLMAVAILFTLMFWRGSISNSSDRLKGIVLALFIISTVFIISAYSSTVRTTLYSYHLAATASILVFLSSILFTYWLGRTSVTFVH